MAKRTAHIASPCKERTGNVSRKIKQCKLLKSRKNFLVHIFHLNIAALDSNYFAENIYLINDNRRHCFVFGLEAVMTVLTKEGLNGGFVFNKRNYDLTVLCIACLLSDNKVTVKDIQRRTKLDDAALLEKLQLKSMDELRDRLRQAMESDNEEARRGKAAEAVYTRLDEMVGEFELPPALLAEETNKEIQKMAREQVKSEEDANKFKEELEAKRAEAETAAKAALRRSLILRKIAKLEEVTVEDAELDTQLAMMSYQYGYKAKELKDMMEKNGAIEEFRIDMINAKTLDKLVGMALK